QSWSGPGWDFDYIGECINEDLDPESIVAEYGARLYTEAAPIPLEKADDFTGVSIDLPEPYDEESGEPYFGLKSWEESDVSELKMQFRKKEGNRYLIEITATVDKSLSGKPEPIHLLAWTEQQPDHAYPG
ncbi:MAG TPA: hypothetical protein VKU00_16205, partial [Chthonomonadaceae bacterium]|nr:hypothetical protein [Chthonomonadaceae bacterium]